MAFHIIKISLPPEKLKRKHLGQNETIQERQMKVIYEGSQSSIVIVIQQRLVNLRWIQMKVKLCQKMKTTLRSVTCNHLIE